jgi:hypothetical protein
VVAPNDAAAAQYYPAIYWYSMLKIPGPDQFGGKGDIPENVKLTDWLNLMKNNGCIGCHQLGGLATRAAATPHPRGITPRPTETTSSLPPQPGNVPAPRASTDATGNRACTTANRPPRKSVRICKDRVRYAG